MTIQRVGATACILFAVIAIGCTALNTSQPVGNEITRPEVAPSFRERLVHGLELLPLRVGDRQLALTEDEASRALQNVLPGVDASSELVRITDDQTIVRGNRLMEDRLVWLFWFSPHECRASQGPATTKCGSLVVIDGLSGDPLIEVDAIG